MTVEVLQIVIFVLIKKKKILVEKRPVKGFSEDQYLLPGGAINEGELLNLDLALKREMMEELGVKPTKYKLLSNKGVNGIFDNLLKPFLVWEWDGEIPKIGLDEDDPYPLNWVEMDIMLNSPIEGSRKIILAIKKHLIALKGKSKI